MHAFLSFLRSIGARLAVVLVVAALFGRAREAMQRRGREAAAERAVLPSLFDRYPNATVAPQRRIGLRSVSLDRIVGTMRHPSQNTADFLPLPRLRGANWRARWQRINRAMDRLVTLPPVDLVQAGDDYYVVDGHNRVAAALHAGALEIDADVTQLVLPGVTLPGQAILDTSALVGNEEVRQAAQGRHSRTVEQRSVSDTIPRRDLLDDPEADG